MLSDIATPPEITPRVREYARRLAEIEPLRLQAIEAAIEETQVPCEAESN